MNKSVKKLWLAALRSGEYKQGKGLLCSFDHKYCCLGVLVDIYHKQTGEGYWEDNKQKFRFVGEDETGSVILPPWFVQKWAGLEEPDPLIDSTGETLAELNDKGTSFEDIAYLIEQNL